MKNYIQHLVITVLLFVMTISILPTFSQAQDAGALIFTGAFIGSNIDTLAVGFRRRDIITRAENIDSILTVGSLFIFDPETVLTKFLTRASNPTFLLPEIDFEAIQTDFNKNNQTLLMQVAGAFTPDWLIVEGISMDEGKIIGQTSPSAWRGLMIIKEGQPTLSHLDEVENFDLFWQEAQDKKWSVFQQIPVIRNHQLQKCPPIPGLYEFRLFVEIETAQRSHFGLVDFHHRMTLDNALTILNFLAVPVVNSQSVSIKNALYLDTGSVSTGFYYNNGRQIKIHDENIDIHADGYTNLLTFYFQN